MSYTYSFFDNQTVGAEDLNKLVNLFVTGGVADNFQDGVPYSVSKLNDVVYANGSAGVVPESVDTLKVSVQGTAVTIQPGTAFFADGTVLTVTAAETLTRTDGAVTYVYLKSSVEENAAYPCVSTASPDGNCVLLAEIAADGTVTDKRVYAKGKVPASYASDSGIALKAVRTVTLEEDTVNLFDGSNTYQYLVLRGSRVRKNYKEGDDRKYEWMSLGFVELATGAVYTVTCTKPETLNSDVYGGTAADGTVQLVRGDFGGAGIRITASITQSDSGVDLNISKYCDIISAAEEFYDYYIYPFTLEIFAF